jgi:hypothetical protein
VDGENEKKKGGRRGEGVGKVWGRCGEGVGKQRGDETSLQANFISQKIGVRIFWARF